VERAYGVRQAGQRTGRAAPSGIKEECVQSEFGQRRFTGMVAPRVAAVVLAVVRDTNVILSGLVRGKGRPHENKPDTGDVAE
jgi:hypothetical protein